MQVLHRSGTCTRLKYRGGMQGRAMELQFCLVSKMSSCPLVSFRFESPGKLSSALGVLGG